MRLRVRTWGSGPRTVLLVHGYSDDSGTWWRVAPALADQGCTVLAPDLRGHGLSPRADGYSLPEFADDLVETFPSGVHVAVGHSLGALVLGLAAPRLQPGRAVFVDPLWLRPRREVPLEQPLRTVADGLPPHWVPEDVTADLASNGRTDPAVGVSLLSSLGPDDVVPVPPALHPGGVVLVPEHDAVLPLAAHGAVEAAGYRILTQPGVGHVMHRDDLDGFVELLLAALDEPAPVH